MRAAGWTILPLIAGAVITLSACDRGSQEPPETEAEKASAPEPFAGGSGAKVTSISGPGGVSSPTLPSGTFVGAGGHFEAGSVLETAKGTLAELELDAGGHLYMNEGTRMALPGGDHPGAVTLERGELVATASESETVLVRSGADELALGTGEVQIRAEGDARRFAVVHGSASLSSGGQTVSLSAGDTISTPLPAQAQAQPPQPTRSLAPLEDTGWARTFDTAAKMADSVPRGVGSLTARRAGTSQERQALRLTDHRVMVNISGRVAHTEVEQAFRNDQAAVLEGIYRFPIPEDGSISGLSLLVGNTWMDGEIVEKQRARQIFQQIVDATVPRDPALLEWERGNVFKLRIFPIPGRGERRIKLSYTQVLPVVGGKLRYRYPLGGTGATGTPIDKFAFTVRLDGREIPAEQQDDITTPMLALERRDRGDIVELHTERESFLPTYDLGLDVPVPETERQVHARSYLDRDGQAYFMVAMQPQFELGVDERPVHYAFVLDRSHSTSPELWTTARGVVDAMTELMDPDDRFTVLACDSACEEHQDGLQAPTSESVSRAQQFLEDQDLAGASDLAGALGQAAELLDRGGSAAQHVVVYLGDGTPTSGEMAPDGIADLLREPLADTRVLAVALGSRSDVTALQTVVDVTGGDLVQADARDDLRALVRELRLRAEVPALRNASLDLPEGMVMARMNNVSAVRPGDTVVVTGKLHHQVSGEIVLRGEGPSGPVSASFPVDLSATRGGSSSVDAHLPRTWAKMQIQHLTKTEGFRAKDDIIALSKDYTVLSRHTALLVLENDAMFKEFNVVRSAKATDAWDGKLDEKKDKAPPEDAPGDNAGLIGGSEASNDAPAERAEPAAPSLEPVPEAEPDTAVNPSDADGFGDGRGRERLDDDDAPEAALDDVVSGDEEEEQDQDRAAEEEENTSDFGGSRSGGASEAKPSSSRPRPAPAPEIPSKKSSSAKRKPKSKRDAKSEAEGFDGEESNEASAPWSRDRDQRPAERRSRRRWSRPRLQIRSASAGGARDVGRVQTLAAAVAADPTDRRAHSKLVRTALATAHPESLQFAQAWADVDPDHAAALEALADALAREGHPIALRAYESVVEVKPFSASEHASLARAYENEGDFARSCSHRRAQVSIKPTLDHQAGLVACLQRAGRAGEALATRKGFIETAVITRGSLAAFEANLDRAIAAHAPALGRGQLRATLTWTGGDDLDIAIVDRKGQRISVLHDGGKARGLASRGLEKLNLTRVRGSVFVEVSRRPGAGEDAAASPAAASLELVTPDGRRTIPVTVGAGTTRVAKVFWTR